MANALTGNGADDADEVPGVIEQVDGEIASFIADGPYDDKLWHVDSATRRLTWYPSACIGGAEH